MSGLSTDGADVQATATDRVQWPVSDRTSSASFEREQDPAVSVVICTRNRSAYLGGLLDALEIQDAATIPFEVVIVDDASTDGTWAELNRLVKETTVSVLALRLTVRLGQGVGRNVGLHATRGTVVAFTDDDCIPRPDWLTALTAPFRPDVGEHPRSVVVQGKTVSWENDRADAGPWARTVWVLRPTWLFETCNIAYRRADLLEVGGFPGREAAPMNRQGKAVGEDAILGWRVMEGGSSLEFVEGAVVAHRNEPASYLQWLKGHLGRAVFPDLVRRSPYGRRVLWHNFFLAPRSAAIDVAIASCTASLITRRSRWLAGALPWIWMALPEAQARTGRHPLVRLAQIGAGDVLGLGAMLGASIRHRSVVL